MYTFNHNLSLPASLPIYLDRVEITLHRAHPVVPLAPHAAERRQADDAEAADEEGVVGEGHAPAEPVHLADLGLVGRHVDGAGAHEQRDLAEGVGRSEEHTSELQSLMRISYAVFCLKKKKTK